MQREWGLVPVQGVLLNLLLKKDVQAESDGEGMGKTNLRGTKGWL